MGQKARQMGKQDGYCLPFSVPGGDATELEFVRTNRGDKEVAEAGTDLFISQR